jgi:uncharacterized protein
MVQKASQTAPGKSKSSRGRAPRNRRVDKRSGKSSRKAGGGFRFAFPSIAKSPRLVFLLAWLMAATALAGLLYWGKSSKPAPQPRTEAAAKHQAPSPGKVFDHRELPGSGEATRQRTTASNDKRQSSGAAEKHTPELLEPPKPRQAPPTDSHAVTHENHHYASRAPESNTIERAPPPLSPQPPSPTLTPPLARVAIVIDDFGPNVEIARRFVELPLAITVSILPHQQCSQEIAELAHAHHRQVILHLPMEPQGYPKVKPGKGALLLSMSGDAIHESLTSALDASPYFTGINNHMGSRFTENAAMMKTVLEEAKKRKLYFVDSYTSPRSVAASVAQQVHIPFRRRDVFLDNNPSEGAIRAQIRQVIRRAKIQGAALAIGHPHESTLRALSQEAGEFEREHIAVVPAGELMPEF